MLVAAWVAAFLAALQRGAADGTTLFRHSLHTGPPDLRRMAPDWFLSGTVAPTTNAIVVQPGVPVRQGVLWSKKPVRSNNFEVKVMFSVSPAAKTEVTGQGFAFWYIHENNFTQLNNLAANPLCNQESILSNTWQDVLKEAGLTLLGYRSKFNGLGVFFVDTGDGPAVSAIVNKGDTEVNYKHKDSFPNARKVGNYADGTKVHMAVRVQPTSVKVEFTGAFTYSWELPAEMRPGGYLGITAYGGDKGTEDPKEKSSVVQLFDLETTNFDSASDAEVKETPMDIPVKSPDEKEDILHASSSYKDHREESDAIKELTNMVFKLVMQTRPMRKQMQTAIESLTQKVEKMEASFQEFKDELDRKTGHHLVAEFDSIKQELSSLSVTASEQHKARQDRLDLLHEDVTEVHKAAHAPDGLGHHLNQLTDTNQRTLDKLNSEHQTMFGVSCCAIAFVLVAGLSLYNKFRCWEKKHVL